MKAISGQNKAREDPRGEQAQRRGLLAKVHIAKKELGLSDAEYEDVLADFGVKSSAELPIFRLELLVRYFELQGWKTKRHRAEGREHRVNPTQIEALRERVWAIASELPNGEARLTGLVRKICGVETFEWCWNVEKLKRLVAAMEKIRRIGQSA